MNKMENLTAQKQLLISEVQWDSQNKQWLVTGQQQYDGVQENVNEPWKRVRRGRREEVEDKTLIEQRLLENGANQMKNHLLILADSAESLPGSVNNYSGVTNSQCRVNNINVHQLQNGLSTHAPSGEKRKKKPLDTSGGPHRVEDGKNASPLDGRIRLTHLRRFARTRNHHLAQESGECILVDPKGSFLVHGGSQVVDFRQPCIVTPLQQLNLPHQMTNSDLLWNEILKGQSMKQRLSTLQSEMEAEKDSKLIPQERQKLKTHLRENVPDEQQVQATTQSYPKLVAKERRKLRKHRRKRRPEEQLVEAEQQSYFLPSALTHQMYDAGQQWHWHMWEFEQQRLLGNAGAGPGKLQLGKHNSPEESTIVEFQRDGSFAKGSFAKGRTRVSNLKREARLKSQSTMESKQETGEYKGEPMGSHAPIGF
ncbi:hypothetical protein MKW98_005821 [Papaver atlanticum]|uniref:Uncharacterized protein n=1 Tax=Papaver atlanticum TaxID=357466 RepID=A0AAD4TE05_9MAGN|nr:hypothetical protein MKW98_005821 [Papaver atlanticum]